MSYNAGSIEASLDLDRSPFQQGIEMAKREAEDFSKKKYKVTLDIDTDGVTKAKLELDRLQEKSDSLDGMKIELNARLDDLAAKAGLDELQLKADRLNGKDVKIHTSVDQNGFSGVESALADVEKSLSSVSSGAAAVGDDSEIGIENLGLMLTGIVTLGAGAVPVFGGLVGQLAQVVGFAGVAVLAFKGLENNPMLAQTQAVTGALKGLNSGLAEMELHAAEGAGFGIASGLNALRPVIPLVTDGVDLLSKSVGQVAEYIGRQLASAIPVVLPMFTDLAGEVERVTQSVGDLGDNQGFRTFIGYARQMVPVVFDLIMRLTGAIVHIFEAAAPAGLVVVKTLDMIARGIEAIPVPVLSALIDIFILWKVYTLAAGVATIALAAAQARLGASAAAGAVETDSGTVALIGSTAALEANIVAMREAAVANGTLTAAQAERAAATAATARTTAVATATGGAGAAGAGAATGGFLATLKGLLGPIAAVAGLLVAEKYATDHPDSKLGKFETLTDADYYTDNSNAGYHEHQARATGSYDEQARAGDDPGAQNYQGTTGTIAKYAKSYSSYIDDSVNSHLPTWLGGTGTSGVGKVGGDSGEGWNTIAKQIDAANVSAADYKKTIDSTIERQVGLSKTLADTDIKWQNMHMPTNQNISDASGSYGDLAGALQKSADSYAALDGTASGATIKIGEQKYALSDYNLAMKETNNNQADAVALLQGNAEKYREYSAAVDEATKEQGRLQDAQSAAEQQLGLNENQVNAYALALGISSQKIADGTVSSDQFVSALSSVKGRLDDASASLAVWNDYIGKVKTSDTSNGNITDILIQGLTASQGPLLGYTQTMLNATKVTMDTKQTIHDNLASIGKDGTLLGQSYVDAGGKFQLGNSKFTEGSIAVATAIGNTRQSAIDAAAGMYNYERSIKGPQVAAQDAMTTYAGLRQSFIDTTVQAGKTKDEAKALADQYFAMPDDVSTFVQMLGEGNVSTAITGLTDSLNHLSNLIATPGASLNPAPVNDAIAGMTSNLDYFGHKQATPQAELDKTAFDNSMNIAKSRLDYFGTLHVSGTVSLIDNASSKLLGIGHMLESLNGKVSTVYVNTVTGGHTAPGNAYGGIYPHFADGGTFDSGFKGGNYAMPAIFNAQAKPLFAEPGTGGEGFVPLANDGRRPRAEGLLGQLAGIFGGGYIDSGAMKGLMSAASQPTGQSVGQVMPSQTNVMVQGGSDSTLLDAIRQLLQDAPVETARALLPALVSAFSAAGETQARKMTEAMRKG